ncbi:MAG: sensor histidine kinase [Devosia sp.]|nr:sensor histidine kinase [Devosia sp.]
MSRPYSLRRRLLFGLIGALLVLGGVAVLDSWREARDTATALSDRVLAGSVLAIAERVVVTDEGILEVDVPYVALEMLTSAAQDRVFYRVDGPAGFVTGYQTLPLPTAPGTEISYSDDVFRGEAIRLATLTRAISTGSSAIGFTVTVAETTIARTHLTQALLVRSAARLAALILVAALVVSLAVSLSFAPLYRLRTAIDSREADDLSPVEAIVPREVRSLVDTINSFMLRLSAALEALRHFTGNASHQLRTPLTVVRTQIALARRAATLAEARAALQVADREAVHSERILGQLLMLARIDATGPGRPPVAVDLDRLAREVTASYVVRAHAAGIDLGYDGTGPLEIDGDEMLLAELLGNLVENVINYAGPGADATVRTYRDPHPMLEVVDSGRGLDPYEIAEARKRFARGRSDKPGAGLGLPIVEEIAALMGGTVAFAPTSPSGLTVRVAFPPH